MPSMDESNPLYCPDLPRDRYLQVVNRHLAHRGRKILRRPVVVNPRNDSSTSTSSQRILAEYLFGSNWLLNHNDDYDLPPSYSDSTASTWSPSLQLPESIRQHNLMQAGGGQKRKRSDNFSDFCAPPKYARSVQSVHDSSFDVQVRRERLRLFDMSSSPLNGVTIRPPAYQNADLKLVSNLEYLINQLEQALPGIRLGKRLRALHPLSPQAILNFLTENGHLNVRTLDILRLSNIDTIVLSSALFYPENGLNLFEREMYSVFSKPDAFHFLTKLCLVGTRLHDSDLVHFHHLPRLSVVLLDGTGITNEAVFLLVPLKGTLSKLSLSMNPKVDNDAVPALLLFQKLSLLSIQDTGIDMGGLRRIAEVVDRDKRIRLRIRIPFSCQDYIDNVESKYLCEPKPPLVVNEAICNRLSSEDLKRNLRAHAARNPDILASGSRTEMVHRLSKILKNRRLDKMVIDLMKRRVAV